jgi:hypothetical protein
MQFMAAGPAKRSIFARGTPGTLLNMLIIRILTIF